jgi:hypothetical protein
MFLAWNVRSMGTKAGLAGSDTAVQERIVLDAFRRTAWQWLEVDGLYSGAELAYRSSVFAYSNQECFLKAYVRGVGRVKKQWGGYVMHFPVGVGAASGHVVGTGGQLGV